MHATPAQWVQLAGALAVVGLGLVVGAVRPRPPPALALAVLAIGFGGTFVIDNASDVLDYATGPWPMFFARIAWIAGVAALAVTFPSRLGREHRAAILAGAAVWLALSVVGVRAGTWSDPSQAIRSVVSNVAASSFYALLVLLAIRFGREADVAGRRQIALLASGILLYAGFAAGHGSTTAHVDGPLARGLTEGPNGLWAWARFGVVVASAGLWLLALRSSSPRLARTVAFVTLGTALAGLAAAALDVRGLLGVGRLLMVLVLAYAILRHQLLGIDVKLRWTLSKSTVAATFVATFFLASEGAQILFGAGNEWAGLAAAGALVFALAPLQRAAERLAEKAVPVAGTPAQARSEPQDLRAAAAFRAAVRAALRDGGITRREELHLMDVAEHVGLTPRQAAALRHEVEDEASGGGT